MIKTIPVNFGLSILGFFLNVAVRTSPETPVDRVTHCAQCLTKVLGSSRGLGPLSSRSAARYGGLANQVPPLTAGIITYGSPRRYGVLHSEVRVRVGQKP